MYQTKNLMRSIYVNTKHVNCRFLSTQAKLKDDVDTKSDTTWENAKPFSEIPGPSKYTYLFAFLPGGKMYNASLTELHQVLRDEYGSIVHFPGIFWRPNMVFTFEPEDYEKVYRTEGIWPNRMGLETFVHYRKHLRPDIFKGMGGLLTEQEKSWGNLRSKLNPILMKPQTVNYNLPQINEIASEFLQRISEIQDPVNHEMPADFIEEVNRWSLESICVIALNTRLGLIDGKNPNPRGTILLNTVKDFFQLSYEFDVLPSIWKYYKTPAFHKLMATYDKMTDTTISCINEAVEKYKDSNELDDSVFGKLLKIDKQAATVMAMDMLMAGIDTTSSAVIVVLYQLAKNPEKQSKLREEIFNLLPEKDSPLTANNIKSMPYLKACMKETFRISSITSGSMRVTGQDLVLGGYQIPKGTTVLLNSILLHNDDKYFPQSKKFIPERWLRDGAPPEGCPSAKSVNPFVYLPFGFGPRSCIGRRIAEMEIQVLISKILRNYKISWNYPDMKFKNNLIITPTGEAKFQFEEI